MKKLVAIVAMVALLFLMAGQADAGLVLGTRGLFKRDSAGLKVTETEIINHLIARGMTVVSAYESEGPPPPNAGEGNDSPENYDLIISGPGCEHRWFSRWNRETEVAIIALGHADWNASDPQWDGLGVTYNPAAAQGYNSLGAQTHLQIAPGYAAHPILDGFVAETGVGAGVNVQITNGAWEYMDAAGYLFNDTEVIMLDAGGTKPVLFLNEKGTSLSGRYWSWHGDPLKASQPIPAGGIRIGFGMGYRGSGNPSDFTPAGWALFDSVVDYARTLGTAETPIPEPAGLGLVGLALLAVRKRRR